MAVPFQAKGERAEWRIVLGLALAEKIGDTVTYGALEESLGRDIRSDRGPIYRAMRRLERDHMRTLFAIPNVGYKVAHAAEHEGIVRSRQRRSRRQVSKGISVARATDRSALSTTERQRIDALEERMTRLDQMMRAGDKRLARIEEVTRRAAAESATASARVAALEEKLTARGLLG
jgi:hypothetical protein